MSSDTVPPPGRSGFMPGEIRGRRAGDTRFEVLPRFLDPRGVIWGVFLELFMVSIWGL